MEAKMEVKSKILESISCGVSNLTIWYHKSISAIYNTHTICFWPQTTSNDLNGGQNGGQIENSWKYIVWGIKIEDLIQQVQCRQWHFYYVVLKVFPLYVCEWSRTKIGPSRESVHYPLYPHLRIHVQFAAKEIWCNFTVTNSFPHNQNDDISYFKQTISV